MSWLNDFGRLKNPTEEQKLEAFTAWYDDPAKVKYREVRAAGGGHVPTREEAYELFCRRWKPVRSNEG